MIIQSYNLICIDESTSFFFFNVKTRVVIYPPPPTPFLLQAFVLRHFLAVGGGGLAFFSFFFFFAHPEGKPSFFGGENLAFGTGGKFGLWYGGKVWPSVRGSGRANFSPVPKAKLSPPKKEGFPSGRAKKKR